MAARKNSSTSAAIAGAVAGLLASGLLGYYLYWNQPETPRAPIATALAQAMTEANSSVPVPASAHIPVPKGQLSRDQAVATLMALPELQAWSKQIEQASQGKAHGAIIEYDDQLREVGGKRYYQLSFIENSDDAAQRWESFLVGQSDGDILIDDDADGAVLSLTQWRETKKPLQRSGPGT